MAIYFFQLDAHGTPCNLGRTLRAFGQQIKLIDVHNASTLPLDLDEVHGIIVCGGGASLTASSGTVESFVRGAAKAEIPMLAIGSGARLVARALGGEISPCSERGVVNAKLNAVGREEPLFAGQPWTCEQAVWNDECVTKLPEGAKAFGSTPSAKFAAWGLGPWIVAIDWHPEWDAKEIAECAHSKEIAECAHSQGAISPATVSSIERLGRLFAERVSIILMPVDRMSSGRVRD
jgi:GMP synthase-like glutamine amidotransferase